MLDPITAPCLKLPPPGEPLPPIADLEFDEKAHRYCYRGDWFPWSSTGIVSDLSPAAKRKIEATREGPDGWEIRGNSVHSILEQYLLGIASGGESGVMYEARWEPWAEPLLTHWLFQGCTVLGCEYRMCDPLKRVGGSGDFLIRLASGLVIFGDLKSVGNAAALKSRKPATAQLGSYVSMLAHWWPTLQIDKVGTLVSAPGECEWKPGDPGEAVEAWDEAWERHQAAELLRGF
jgi:hypothetical protein